MITESDYYSANHDNSDSYLLVLKVHILSHSKFFWSTKDNWFQELVDMVQFPKKVSCQVTPEAEEV